MICGFLLNVRISFDFACFLCILNVVCVWIVFVIFVVGMVYLVDGKIVICGLWWIGFFLFSVFKEAVYWCVS